MTKQYVKTIHVSPMSLYKKELIEKGSFIIRNSDLKTREEEHVLALVPEDKKEIVYWFVLKIKKGKVEVWGKEQCKGKREVEEYLDDYYELVLERKSPNFTSRHPDLKFIRDFYEQQEMEYFAKSLIFSREDDLDVITVVIS